MYVKLLNHLFYLQIIENDVNNECLQFRMQKAFNFSSHICSILNKQNIIILKFYKSPAKNYSVQLTLLTGSS